MPTGPFLSAAGFIEALGLLLLGLCAFVTSYPLANRMLGASRLSLRLSATVMIAYFEAVALFHLLAAFSLFRREVALPGWLVLALISVFFASRAKMGQALLEDGRQLIRLAQKARRSWVGVLVAGVSAVLLVHLLRGLVAPSLGWDGLTYHLFKAGRWIQTGTWISEAAPDAWTYYRYFPPGGDILWAWIMLPGHTSSYVAVGGLFAWLVLLLASYTLAALLGASRQAALLTALGVATMPCIFGYLISPYVNTILLSLLLIAFCFLHRVLYDGSSREAVLAAASLALALTVQTSALPFLALGAIAILVGVCRREKTPGRRLFYLSLAAVPLVVAVPAYWRAWIETGSPLYPLTLALGDTVILQGNAQLAALFAAEHLPAFLQPTSSWPALMRTLFIPQTNFFYPQHLNFGPAPILLLAMGLFGSWRLLKRGPCRGAVMLLLSMAALVVLGLMPPAMLGHRTVFAGQVGRLLAPGLAAIAIIGATVAGPVANGFRWLVVMGGLYFAIPPAGLGSRELSAMLRLSPTLVPLVVFLGVVWLFRKRLANAKWAAAVGLGVWLLLSGAILRPIRAQYRYDVFQEAAKARSDGPAFHIHPLWTDYVGAWPVWRHCDRRDPQRIAFAAGWDATGHNWFRTPLLGSQLQNEVFYLSPTRSGDIVSYGREEELRAQWDTLGWVRRLLKRRIDLVVAAPPLTIEQFWMRRNPEVFQLESQSEDKKSQAFRLNRKRAIAWVARIDAAIRSGRQTSTAP